MIQVLPRSNFQNLPKEPDIGNKMSMSAFFSLCTADLGNQKSASNSQSAKSKKRTQKSNTTRQRKPSTENRQRKQSNKKYNKTDNTCSSSSSGVDMAEIMSKSPSDNSVKNKRQESNYKNFDVKINTNYKAKIKNSYKNKQFNNFKRYYEIQPKGSDTNPGTRQYAASPPTQFKSFIKSNSYPPNRNHSRCTIDSTSSYTVHSDSGVSSGQSSSLNNIAQAQYNPKQAYNFNNNFEYYHNQTVQCQRTKVRVATLHESPDEDSTSVNFDILNRVESIVQDSSCSIKSNDTQLKNNQTNYNISNTSKDSSSSLGFDDLPQNNPRYAGLAAAPEPITLPDPPLEWLSKICFSQKNKKKKSNKNVDEKNETTGKSEKFNIINNTAKSDVTLQTNCVKETTESLKSSINKIAT